jgi:hypothetical protein
MLKKAKGQKGKRAKGQKDLFLAVFCSFALDLIFLSFLSLFLAFLRSGFMLLSVGCDMQRM